MKNKLLVLFLILISLLCIGIGYWYFNSPKTPTSDPTNKAAGIESVERRYASSLMSVSGVAGTGIGECNGKPCLRVYLEKETPESENIPTEIEGFKIEKVVTGQIIAR